MVFALLVNLWNHVKAQTNMGWNELGFQSNKGSVSSSGGISPSPICIDKHDNIYSIQQDLIHIKKWDGINWADITSNFKSKILSAIVLDRHDSLYAAGMVDSTNRRYAVLKWNGTNNWRRIDTTTYNYDITKMCFDTSNNLYITGGFTDSTMLNGNNYIAKWNGNTWSIPGNFKFRGIVSSMCSDNSGNIYAVGWGIKRNGYEYAAKWDGTNWSVLGGTILDSSSTQTPYCNVIKSDSLGNIYCGGSFMFNNGKDYLLKWNGLTWAKVGSMGYGINPSGQIFNLDIENNGTIYCVGDFIDSSTFNSSLWYKRYVAKWNGSSWSNLGRYSASQLNNVYTNSFYLTNVFHDSKRNIYVSPILGSDTTNYHHIYKYGLIDTALNVRLLNNRVCRGSLDSIEIITHSTYNSGNVFMLELGDANGNFNQVVNSIGSKSAMGNCFIKFSIPAPYSLGNSSYRIRARSTNPYSIGTQDSIDFNVIGLQDTTTMYLIGNYLFCLDSFLSNGVNRFQWYDCITNKAIQNAIYARFTPPYIGDFKVRVISKSDSTCYTESRCMNISSLGINEIYWNSLYIQPNPTATSTTLTFNNELSNTTVEVMNVTGQIVIKKENQSGKQFNVDLSNQTAGIYFIKVKQAAEVWRGKVIKQ